MKEKQKAIESFRNNINPNSTYYEVTQKASDDEILELINISLVSSSFLKNSVSNLFFSSLVVQENNYSEKILKRLNDIYGYVVGLPKSEKKLYVKFFFYGLKHEIVEDGKKETFMTLMKQDGMIVNKRDKIAAYQLYKDNKYVPNVKKFNTTETRKKISEIKLKVSRASESVLNKAYSVFIGVSIRIRNKK